MSEGCAQSADKLELACQHLQKGDVIAYPTEAVWGLGCDPGNQTAVERILQIKQRQKEKGLILCAASIEQLGQLLDTLSESQLTMLQESWPGPVTWLIPDPANLIPEWIKGSHSSVAIRVSAHPLIVELCTLFDGPIVSTSANRAGEPEIREQDQLEKEFAGDVDFIVSGSLGEAGQPSQIRDLASGKIIR